MHDHYLKKELYDLVKSDSKIFEFIQAGSLDGIWYWDVENPEHEWMSDRFWTVLGYDPKEKQPLASEWQDIINQDDLAVAIDNFNKHCADPSHPYDQIVRYRHKNGSIVWIRCRGIGVRDHHGKVTRLLGAHTDLTSLKTFEHAFIEKEQALLQLENLINSMQDPILCANKEGMVLFTNNAAKKHLQLETQANLNKIHLESIFPLGSNQTFFNAYNSVLSSRQPQYGLTQDITVVHGNAFPAEVSISAFDNLSHDTAGVIVIRDISLILKQKQELESLNTLMRQRNQEMEQFIYTVSHDLKSPLVTIGGYAHRLQQSLDGQLDEKQQRQFDRIAANIEHMDRLLKDLLDLSRVIQREIEVNKINLNQLIESSLTTIETQIEQCKATIDIQQPLANPFANEGLLFQGIVNLLNNAIEYRDPERPLAITIKSTKLNSGVQVDISDTGIGIDEKHFDKIFKIFERLDVGQGTGVGLTIVKAIMEKHKGHIELYSTPGQGSTFSLYFPNL